ncbi:MAG: acyl-ACP thioesterase [Oscillospiraceae bacterium]|jgi:acyl-ACP thioesterase|nr:acyl-ACP thioesterase [Oscillospiraceae bacterium]
MIIKGIGSVAFSTERVIGASHVTPDNRLRYSAIVDLMQDCEGFQLDSMTEFREYFKDNGIGIFLTSRQIDIRRLPLYGEKLAVATAVYECKTVYGFRNTNIRGADGEICVCSHAAGAFVDLETGRPRRIPAEIINAFDMRERFDMEYLPRKIAVPGGGFKRLGELKITRYLLDAYNHVNNARYVDLALEFLPADLSVKRIRLEYRAPAALNDLVSVFSRESGGKITVDLRGGETSFAVAELTL